MKGLVTVREWEPPKTHRIWTAGGPGELKSDEFSEVPIL